MPALLDRLRTQMSQAQDRYRSLETLITGEDRDPSDVEQGELDHLRARMSELQPQIVEHVELERRLNAGAEALASLPSSTPAAPASGSVRPSGGRSTPGDAFRSWGEFAIAVAGGDVTREVRESVYDSQLNYLIEHSRALVDMTTGDVAGLVPPIWIRDLADTISAAQPFINAFSSLPLPDAGMTLTYPSITARPLVGKQVGEKTDIPSRKARVVSATAPVSTYGGGEDVSVQVIQRTDPAYLSLMLELYAEAMALVCDTDAITAALAATTLDIDLGGDPTTYNAALATAAGGILRASRLMPDTFVVSVDIWEAFAGAADTDGRPIFPNVAPSNPVGTASLETTGGNARGLSLVVDPNMPVNTGLMGNRIGFTSLLGAVQTLSADNVSKLGTDYAVFRFASFIVRRPDALAKVHLTPVAGP